MSQLTFSIAQPADAVKAVNLFIIEKNLDIKSAIDLFTKEFSICKTNPEQRVYFLAQIDEILVAYAGARFYDQTVDENMYGTKQLLPTGWYLRGLKVHPKWRRIGVAREITKRRLEWLSKRTERAMVFLTAAKKQAYIKLLSAWLISVKNK